MNKKCPDCKSYLLPEIPNDVWDIIIDEQAKEQKKSRGRIGKREIIYRIIRRYAKQEKEKQE
ncbi:MAG TPA: hypothetical protein P5509_09070 [Bacteroidales bacterium]|nr:hypothetical protein [Bacteroidales bacterium]